MARNSWRAAKRLPRTGGWNRLHEIAPNLAFDEATSAPHSEVETVIQESPVREPMRNNTVVAIAGHSSAIAATDGLILMDGSRIVGDNARGKVLRARFSATVRREA